ncbi:carbohydrate-binding protein [Saccharopolyspora spinosporotrichia]
MADAPSAGRYVGSVANGDWLRFDDVDFGTSPTREVSARLAKWTSEGEKAKIEIRVDDYNAPPIAKINVTPSGGAWKSVPVEIQPLSGVHDVYLVFSSEQDGGFLNLDWVRFVG